MKQRIKSANINLRDEIASIINKKDYFNNEFVTITEVDISNDMKHMKIFLSCLPEEKINNIIEKLNKNRYKITQELSKKVKIKYIPKIKFHKDKGYENYKKIEDIIAKENEQK